MKKLSVLFLLSFVLLSLLFGSDISEMADLYKKASKTGNPSDYIAYTKLENKFLSGLPGNKKFSSRDEYRKAWKETVKEFEEYWSTNCPMENYSEYPAKLNNTAISRPGSSSTYYILVDWKTSPAFDQCKRALRRGYVNAYNITGLPGLAAKWPAVSTHSASFDFSSGKYLAGNVPLVRTSSGTISPASYYVGPKNTMYQAFFNLVDKNGKIYYSGTWQHIGPASRYDFPDVPKEAADLIKKGLVFAKPAGLRLTYGDINSFDFKEIKMDAEKTGLAGRTSKNRFEESKEKFFCGNRDLISAIMNGDSSGVERLLQDYFVLVPEGKFTMGDGEGKRDSKPKHTVALDSFYMQVTEVPQWLYEAVMGENPSINREGGLPVEYVSWHKAALFCNKLSELAGLEPCYKNIKESSLGGTGSVICDFNANGYRLPTEAEWEYAAKGGGLSYRAYKYSGSDTADDCCVNINCKNNSTISGPKKCASLLPNDLGLYDMSGNVWEWCNDIYGSYKAEEAVNPKGPSAGEDYVLRGGSWGSSLSECSPTGRRSEKGSSLVFAEYSSNSADKEKKTIGLRLCRRH